MAENCFCNDGIEEGCRQRLTEIGIVCLSNLEEAPIMWEKIDKERHCVID